MVPLYSLNAPALAARGTPLPILHYSRGSQPILPDVDEASPPRIAFPLTFR
jgi:hypothetical protein